jgi:hypothetical protein
MTSTPRRIRRVALGASLLAATALTSAPAPAADGTPSGPTDKITDRALACRATFTSGSGGKRIAVCVTKFGTLQTFESPAGAQHVFGGLEGYTLCADGNLVGVHIGEGFVAGFGRPTFDQPTPGAFPLTITRRSLDGTLRLRQVWARPDTKARSISVKMTVTNISGGPVPFVRLSRSTDIDANGSALDLAGSNGSGSWQYDANGAGLLVRTEPTAIEFLSFIANRGDWFTDASSGICIDTDVTQPAPSADYASRVTWFFGTMAAGSSRTVTATYARL